MTDTAVRALERSEMRCRLRLPSLLLFLIYLLQSFQYSHFHLSLRHQLIHIKKRLVTLLKRRHCPNSLTDNWLFPVQNFSSLFNCCLNGNFTSNFFLPTVYDCCCPHLEDMWHNQYGFHLHLLWGYNLKWNYPSAQELLFFCRGYLMKICYLYNLKQNPTSKSFHTCVAELLHLMFSCLNDEMEAACFMAL